MNIVTLHGNMVADPELRQTSNNKSVVRFTVAVKRKVKDKNGDYPCDFHPCQAWGSRADTIAKYFAKGSPIMVQGELQNNNYEKDGVKHYGYVVNINDFDFVGSNKNSPAARGEEVKPANYLPSEISSDSMGELGEFEEVVGDDSLPF